jgi:proton-translocating NADH-quinone oxidoreductase chain N
MSLVLLVVMPLLAAFIYPLVYRVSNSLARYFGFLAILLNIAMGLAMWQDIIESGPQTEYLGGFLAPLGIVFHADLFSIVLVLLIAVMSLLLWPKGQYDALREPTLALVMLAGCSGLALSADLFNLFVFYELVAVASYGLAASKGTGASYAAALRFMIISATGSALALLGIALIYTLTGTLNLAQLSQLAPAVLSGSVGMAAFTLILIGFGVKAELFPVNVWVPEVYATTTSRISGLLSGIVSKLALLIVMRLLLLVFANTDAPLLLLVVALLTLVSGELAAYHARDLRRVLAYSSIGQLGMVALGFSVANEAGVLAGFAMILHHMLVKPALFLLAEKWNGPLHRLEGAARVSPLSAALFLLLILSLIGVPPLPGFWAKYLLISALMDVENSFYYLAAASVLLMTVIEVAYFLRIVRKLYMDTPAVVSAHEKRDLIPTALYSASILLATVFITPIGAGLTQAAKQTTDVDSYAQRIIPAAADQGGPI